MEIGSMASAPTRVGDLLAGSTVQTPEQASSANSKPSRIEDLKVLVRNTKYPTGHQLKDNTDVEEAASTSTHLAIVSNPSASVNNSTLNMILANIRGPQYHRGIVLSVLYYYGIGNLILYCEQYIDPI